MILLVDNVPSKCLQSFSSPAAGCHLQRNSKALPGYALETDFEQDCFWISGVMMVLQG